MSASGTDGAGVGGPGCAVDAAIESDEDSSAIDFSSLGATAKLGFDMSVIDSLSAGTDANVSEEAYERRVVPSELLHLANM
jgi:hypothetical protein